MGFDIRSFVLVDRTTPHLWFFHPGYCKVGLGPYDSIDFSDKSLHITNACMQKSHPQYKQMRGSHIWSNAEAEAHLRSTGHWSDAEAGSFWRKMHDEMKRSMAWLYRASVDKLERRSGFFEL